jgi:hypothetical protein
VDEATSMVWSYFLTRKSETEKRMLEFIMTMRSRDQDMVKYLRCDNSPENKRLAEEVDKKGLKVNFEFTELQEHLKKMGKFRGLMKLCGGEPGQC